MTTVYVIRHAEAEGNLYRRVHGHYDSLVTDLGLRQIEALERRFADIPIDAVYASDLVRAQSTARAVAEPKNLPLITTPRLREVDMGEWEDLTWAHVERDAPEQYRNFVRDPARWVIRGNERLEPQRERIVTAVTDLAARHDGGSIALVSHGNVIRVLLAHILNIPSERFLEIPHCENTGVSLLRVEGSRMEVVFKNDGSHLTPEISTFARQSWWKNKNGTDRTNLDFLPMDLDGARDRYQEYRRDAWQAAHGTMAGYSGQYIQLAHHYAEEHPQAVVEAFLGDEPAGLLELAVSRGRQTGEGAIAFYYMRPEMRNRGLAVQLLGHAVSVYRALGRRKLTLNVAEENTHAIGFYQRFGFKRTGTSSGALGPLWAMEKDIEVKVL